MIRSPSKTTEILARVRLKVVLSNMILNQEKRVIFVIQVLIQYLVSVVFVASRPQKYQGQKTMEDNGP